MYDVCVVGAGTMGSSAAYYLSKNTRLNICLLGPGEPEAKTRDREVFGCHYDEGRITRVISQIETEQILAYRSTLCYPELEQLSGLRIFWEVGSAVIGQAGDTFVSEFSSVTDKFCEKNGLVCEEVNETFVKERWSYFLPPENCSGRFSKKFNGYISVRNLVSACQVVAENNGVQRNFEVVKDITKYEGNFKITLDGGDVISCKKIVLACGSFTNFFNILPSKRKLELQLIGHSVLKLELNEKDSKDMADFPSMIYKPNLTSSYIYILPPIKYPNGKTYLKIGHVVYPKLDENKLGKVLTTLEEVQEWYCQKDYPKARKYFKTHFESLYPGVNPLSEELDFCVMAMTTSGKQLIGFVEENFIVAGGGNGKSAKFGLEIGRICADSIVKGEWDCDHLDPDDFRIRYNTELSA